MTLTTLGHIAKKNPGGGAVRVFRMSNSRRGYFHFAQVLPVLRS